MKNARSDLIKKRDYKEVIVGDNLSLYIANSPVSARYLAGRIGNSEKTLLELCCGVGVTLEAMSRVFSNVIGVDYDQEVLEQCEKNLKDIGTRGKIKLVHGNVTDIKLIKTLSADVVIYDIPYWYPEKYPSYTSTRKEDVSNPDLNELISAIREHITKDIVIFAPREQLYDYFHKLLGDCESQRVFVDGKHDRNYIFLGGLIESKGETEIKLKI